MKIVVIKFDVSHAQLYQFLSISSNLFLFDLSDMPR